VGAVNVMRTLIAVFVGCFISTSVFAGVPDDAWRQARVRPQDPRLVNLIREGVARSATFRNIVNRLEAGNVFVYVSLSPTLPAGMAGKLTWISHAGAFRYLKATINTDQKAMQMIATLAHELQHALEVSDDPAVVDQRSLAGLYQRIGQPSMGDRWETAAARDTGFQVHRELIAAAAAATPTRVADSTQS
jgi:hypothetical protein